MAKIACEVCGQGMIQNVSVFRVNKPGEMPARWRCRKHLVTDQSATVDAVVRDIADTIDPQIPDNRP